MIRRWVGVRRVVSTVSALALFAVGAVAADRIADGDAGPAGAAPQVLTETGFVSVGGFVPRSGAAVAWTGSKLFVFGGLEGSRLRADGALVDARTGVAEMLPAPPFATPLLSPKAERVGNSIFVTGTTCAGYAPMEDSASANCERGSESFVAGLFDPATKKWQQVATPAALTRPSALPASPLPEGGELRWSNPKIVGTTSDGRVVVSIGWMNQVQREYWVLTPLTSTWEKLDNPGNAKDACMVGDDLVVLTGKYDNGGDIVALDPSLTLKNGEVAQAKAGAGWVQPELQVLGLGSGVNALNASKVWRRTSPLGSVKYPTLPPDLWCMGTSALLVGSNGAGSADGLRHVYDFARDKWSQAAEPPPPPAGEFIGGVFGKTVWTGAELIFLNELPNLGVVKKSGATIGLLPGRAYRPSTNTWRVLPPVDTRPNTPVWTGSVVIDYTQEFTGIGELRNGKNPSQVPGIARINPN